MKNLNENFKKLESDVAVVKNVNNILCKQIVSVERQCWKNAQYSRRICRVLQHIGANITNEKIESCHRLNKNADRTIVKFLRRKDCDQVMKVKSKLKKLKSADVDLPVGTKLYIDEVCVPTPGDCGASARNYGIGANCFRFYCQWICSCKATRKWVV